jgi:hypothetical protein
MNVPENAHLLIFPAAVLLLFIAIASLSVFLAWDYLRYRQRQR